MPLEDEESCKLETHKVIIQNKKDEYVKSFIGKMQFDTHGAQIREIKVNRIYYTQL